MDPAAFTFKQTQYPAKEQAKLRVRIKVPGPWFENLTASERSEMNCTLYEALMRQRGTYINSMEAHKFSKRAGLPCA